MKTSFSFPPTEHSIGGDLERLVLHLEHLSEAAALLKAGGVARERMALVAADHLAEVLLQRHMEAHFHATEELGRMTPRRYDRDHRRRLAGDFAARVRLACEPPLGFGMPQPLLDSFDATTFRVAHGYRNALYHGDRHNTTLTKPLALAYLKATGRALVRGWAPGHAIGGLGSRNPRLRALRRLGWSSSGDYVALYDATAECIEHLVGRLRLNRATLCRRLIEDIVGRCADVEARLHDIGRYGLTREEQRDLLRAALLWAANRADPELIRLQDEQDAVIRARSGKNEAPTKRELDAYTASGDAQQRRINELRGAMRAPVSIDTARTMPNTAKKLAAAPDVATLLERYERLDTRLRLLEEATFWVESELERHVQHEIDLARGK